MVGPWVSIFLAVLGSAWAQEPPEPGPPAPDAPPPGRGVLFQVYDPGGVLAAPPDVTLTDSAGIVRTASPRDDGGMPDVQAGDGVHSAPVPDVAPGPLTAVLRSGEAAWTLTAELSADDPLPRLIVIVDGDVARVAPADAPIPGSASAPRDGGEAMTGPAGGVGGGPPAAAAGPGVLGGIVAPIVISSLAFGLGLGLGLRRGRWRPDLTALVVPTAAELPPTGERRVAWGLAEDVERVAGVAAVARRAARRGLVLLAPAPARRAALAAALEGEGAVYLPRADRLDPDTLLRALAAMRALGPAVLVVDGPEALEAPLDEEGPEAVVVELLEGDRGRGPVVVVLGPGASTPVAATLGPEIS